VKGYLLIAIVVAALAAVPLFVSSNVVLNFLVVTLMIAVAGQGWNIIGGYGGQYSFGHAAFFGTGAYVTAILQVRYGVNAWIGFAAGIAAGAAVGGIIGGLTFRAGLRSSYFALVTLAFAEVLRILASVAPMPGNDAVVRRAAQMAASVDAPLDVVHITSRPDGDRELARLRQVTSDVGASWHQLRDEDLVGALIEFARGKQVTQIVVGASRRSRWQELISGGSVVQRVSRRAARAGIDVHIVAPAGADPSHLSDP